MNEDKFLNAFTGPSTYQITVQGNIDDSFLSLLGNMSVSHTHSRDRDLSTLTGELADQSALSGVLNTLIDYRFTVLSVMKLDN